MTLHKLIIFIINLSTFKWHSIWRCRWRSIWQCNRTFKVYRKKTGMRANELSRYIDILLRTVQRWLKQLILKYLYNLQFKATKECMHVEI